MGECVRARDLSDAPGGPAAHRPSARSALSAFAADRRGATAIEYAIVASGIMLAIVSAVMSVGPEVSQVFVDLAPAF
ncbi:MAG: Flp family type IVb pilin [Alphaproteobacteria bacterium]|nr:Flp family type IVb pilin [Alphaproteobacteria bacterium]